MASTCTAWSIFHNYLMLQYTIALFTDNILFALTDFSGYLETKKHFKRVKKTLKTDLLFILTS